MYSNIYKYSSEYLKCIQACAFVSYMVINKLLELTSYVTEHFLFGGLVDLSIVRSVVKPGVRPYLG
jgi:hypothetical protein